MYYISNWFTIFFSFLGLSQSLPVTSYIKMIDIWMLFTMTVPFLEVVLHTTNEVFKRPNTILNKRVDVVRVKSAEEQEEEDEMLKMSNSMNFTIVRLTSRLGLPIGSLIFTVIFWVVGLIASYFSGAIQDPDMTDCLTVDLN